MGDRARGGAVQKVRRASAEYSIDALAEHRLVFAEPRDMASEFVVVDEFGVAKNRRCDAEDALEPILLSEDLLIPVAFVARADQEGLGS